MTPSPVAVATAGGGCDPRPLRRLSASGARIGHMGDSLPILTFDSGAVLRQWLEQNHACSAGIWVRIYKGSAGVPSVTFEEVLEQGICFGWSESMRRRFDDTSYLQRFTPRRTRGTTSTRNRGLADRLIREGQMTAAGIEALGIGE